MRAWTITLAGFVAAAAFVHPTTQHQETTMLRLGPL